jgi:hypothetical protein
LSSGGVIQCLFFAETDRAFPFFDSPGMDFRRIGSDIGGYTIRDMVWPSFQRWEVTGSYQLNIPLWLLAFLCLAWPVTSFVVARRRRRTRGFEVEAKADSAVSTVDS